MKMSGYKPTPDDSAFLGGSLLKFLGLYGDYWAAEEERKAQLASLGLAREGLANQGAQLEEGRQDSLEQLAMQHYQRESDSAGVLGASGMAGASLGARGQVRSDQAIDMADSINRQAEFQSKANELQSRSLDLKEQALERQRNTDAISFLASTAGLGLDSYNDALENNWFGSADPKNKMQGYAYKQGLRS